MSDPVKFKFRAGPCPDKLTDVTGLVNTSKPHDIKSERFDGQIALNVFDMPDQPHSDYFEREDRKGISWSIQVQGRFLQPVNADNLMFGFTFDWPLRLPFGSAAAIKIVQHIDPTLEEDLASKEKPWALSPLISTMPHLVHTKINGNQATPLFPPKQSIGHDVSQLPLEPHPRTSQERRAYFKDAENRKSITFDKDDCLSMDFCYGFISFNPSLALALPGGLHFDLLKHWESHPVRFICCERTPADGDPWGKIFWCVVIEREDGKSAGNDQEKGKNPHS